MSILWNALRAARNVATLVFSGSAIFILLYELIWLTFLWLVVACCTTSAEFARAFVSFLVPDKHILISLSLIPCKLLQLSVTSVVSSRSRKDYHHVGCGPGRKLIRHPIHAACHYKAHHDPTVHNAPVRLLPSFDFVPHQLKRLAHLDLASTTATTPSSRQEIQKPKRAIIHVVPDQYGATVRAKKLLAAQSSVHRKLGLNQETLQNAPFSPLVPLTLHGACPQNTAAAASHMTPSTVLSNAANMLSSVDLAGSSDLTPTMPSMEQLLEARRQMRSAVAGSVEAFRAGEHVDQSSKFEDISQSLTHLDFPSAATTVSTLPPVINAIELRSQLHGIVKTLWLPEVPIATPSLETPDANSNAVLSTSPDGFHAELPASPVGPVFEERSLQSLDLATDIPKASLAILQHPEVPDTDEQSAKTNLPNLQPVGPLFEEVKDLKDIISHSVAGLPTPTGLRPLALVQSQEPTLHDVWASPHAQTVEGESRPLSKIDMSKVKRLQAELREMEVPKVDMPAIHMRRSSLPQIEILKMKPPKIDMPKVDAPKVEMFTFKTPMITASDKPSKLPQLPELKLPDTFLAVPAQLECPDAGAKRMPSVLPDILTPKESRRRFSLCIPQAIEKAIIEHGEASLPVSPPSPEVAVAVAEKTLPQVVPPVEEPDPSSQTEPAKAPLEQDHSAGAETGTGIKDTTKSTIGERGPPVPLPLPEATLTQFLGGDVRVSNVDSNLSSNVNLNNINITSIAADSGSTSQTIPSETHDQPHPSREETMLGTTTVFPNTQPAGDVGTIQTPATTAILRDQGPFLFRSLGVDNPDTMSHPFPLVRKDSMAGDLALPVSLQPAVSAPDLSTIREASTAGDLLLPIPHAPVLNSQDIWQKPEFSMRGKETSEIFPTKLIRPPSLSSKVGERERVFTPWHL